MHDSRPPAEFRPRQESQAAPAPSTLSQLERDILVSLLELDHIDTYYARVQALQQVSMTIDEGEIVTLIGSNGAGKTTTLRTISGLRGASLILPLSCLRGGTAVADQKRIGMHCRLRLIQNIELTMSVRASDTGPEIGVT